jgi:hypothetical protein
MTGYKQMWDVKGVEDATRDIGIFVSKTHFVFGLRIGFSASYLGYLRYLIYNKTPHVPFHAVKNMVEKVIYQQRKHSDAEIVVQDKTFPVDSEILCGMLIIVRNFSINYFKSLKFLRAKQSLPRHVVQQL